MARLFLSYRRVDEASARAAETALRAEGHDVFMDCLPDAGIAPGENWETRLYDELHQTDAVVAMLSAAYLDSHWCFAELAIARARGVTVFPLRLEKNVQHPLLSAIQYVDASDSLVSALERLAGRLRALDTPGGRVWNPDRPLYRGLESFDTRDEAVFFGRTSEIGDLTKLLSTPAARSERHPLLVVGPSGSGKSSVVRAGLMPALARRDEWLVLPAFFPGEAPFTALAFQMVKTLRQANVPADLTIVKQRMRDDVEALVADLALSGGRDAARLLIVVDQFEELATRTPAPDARAFLAWIEKAVSVSVLTVSVVGALRSDSVSRIQQLWGRPSQSVVSYFLAPLGRDDLAEVVKGPARVAGIHVPDPLVAMLVDETSDGLALPFLSFVLRELATGKRRGDSLDVDRYRELGGVKHALAQQADAALEEAVSSTGAKEETIVRLLLGLVTVDDAGRPVRRRRSTASFSEDQRRILDEFVSRRLLTSTVEGDAVVDVAHEAFFQSWPPLAEAIRTQRAELELRRDLERDASAWTRAERAPRYLWSGERSRGVVFDGDLSPEERAFLQASIDAARHADQARADVVISQVLLADLPKIQPEMALALATIVAHEIALTPRVARCLHDALVWHEAEEPLGAFDVPGLQAAHLSDSLDLLTVSTGVAYAPPQPAASARRHAIVTASASRLVARASGAARAREMGSRGSRSRVAHPGRRSCRAIGVRRRRPRPGLHRRAGRLCRARRWPRAAARSRVVAGADPGRVGRWKPGRERRRSGARGQRFRHRRRRQVFQLQGRDPRGSVLRRFRSHRLADEPRSVRRGFAGASEREGVEPPPHRVRTVG